MCWVDPLDCRWPCMSSSVLLCAGSFCTNVGKIARAACFIQLLHVSVVLQIHSQLTPTAPCLKRLTEELNSLRSVAPTSGAEVGPATQSPGQQQAILELEAELQVRTQKLLTCITCHMQYVKTLVKQVIIALQPLGLQYLQQILDTHQLSTLCCSCGTLH